MRVAVPAAIRAALGREADRYEVSGSAGQSEWTHTPWVAILDPAETDTVEEGLYVVYIMSLGCERLYLTLAQGCTTLFKAGGKRAAHDELVRRAAVVRERVTSPTSRLTNIEMNLGAEGWRAELYEDGQILTREYQTTAFPSDGELQADLRAALDLYRLALQTGGWSPDDAIIDAAEDETGVSSLEQAKVYRQHRRIERNASHSRKVKRLQGSSCRACGVDPSTIYGPLAKDMVDAHHLKPLAALRNGERVTYDPRKDFAVLCPNCHRAIHRLEDVSDLDALRRAISTATERP